MRSTFVVTGFLFLMLPVVGGAQTSLTISISPNVVKGMPYTAYRTTHVTRTLADGSVVTQEFEGMEARDSAGRMYEDSRIVPKDSAAGKTPVTIMSVYDPTARTLLQWNSASKRALLLHLPQPSAAVRPLLAGNGLGSDNAAKPEDLGQQEIAGLPATGKRTVRVIPAEEMGNDEAITETREVWTAEDLKIVVREVSKNPRQGERSSELSNIKRGEPDASLFHLPEGYQAMEHTPGLPGIGKAAGSPDAKYQQMIQQAQQGTGTVIKDDVAYQLATAKVDLPEALMLAQAAVKQLETESAAVDADKATSADFNRMVELSRAWHTLGFIYFREGEFETAAKYMKAAWELEPLGYFGYHLGRVYEEEGDSQKAIATYQLALSGEMSAKEEALIRDRLTALAGTASAVQNHAQVVSLPSSGDLNGSAVFNVISVADGETVVRFVSGPESLRNAGAKMVRSSAGTFSLPDDGPEKIVRRTSVACGAEGCAVSILSSKEARKSAVPAA